jgi:hypothetical protein
VRRGNGELLGPVPAVIQGGAQNELRHFRSKFPPGVPSSAPPSERCRMRPRPDVAKAIEPNLAPVPRGHLERYVTGFRDLTAVCLREQSRTGTSDDEDPVCCLECA